MRRHRGLVSFYLLFALAGTCVESAGAAGSGDVSVCQIGAWSTDDNPNGLNIRVAPGTDSPVIGNVPPPRELDGDPFASEVWITGSQDGWFRIESAYFIDYYQSEKDEVFFEGEGWVSGRYLGLSIEGTHLYSEPSRDAPVVVDFYDRPEAERGADYFGLDRLHGCQGLWVEVEGTYFGTRVRGWTNDTCMSQVTTCP